MRKIPFEDIDKKEFVDLPGTKPPIKFPLEKVGITNRNHYIRVIDPFTNKEAELFGDIRVFLNLPANQRGLHMSRIEKELHNMKSKEIVSLKDYAIELCEKIKELQEQENCGVEITVNYEKLVSKNISQRPSHELIKLHVSVELIKDDMTVTQGITVPFINACPCTQRWGMKDFFHSLKSQGLNKEDAEKIVESAPLQAHTNKGDATLIIHSDKIDFPEIYNILDLSSPLCRELLSGKDEHFMVSEAHKRGMFSEDVAREIVSNTANSLKNKIEPNTLIEIIVEVDESIHVHDLYVEVKDTLENLNKKLLLN